MHPMGQANLLPKAGPGTRKTMGARPSAVQG